MKIPKGQSESIYRRRTDNTMVKRKGQKDNQRSTKHTYKTKDQVAQTKNRGELRCLGRVGSSCSTSDTRHECHNEIINKNTMYILTFFYH